jgi:hypothetical protein
MKRLPIILFSFIFFILLISQSTAQIRNSKAATFVVPQESIQTFIKPLLPYKINFGKNFSGSFWIQSIENISIEKDKILFSSHIFGKDIGYSAKLGKRTAVFELGNVNLHNFWTASLRYDKSKKKLFVKPHIEGPSNQKDLSQGDMIVNTLLEAFSDIEYPVEVDKLKPITSKFFDQAVIINVAIADVYAKDNKLFLEMIATAHIDDSKGQ